MIAVEAQIVLTDASRRDEVVASTAELQRATREDEPGCLVYCFAADPVVPDRIQVYELWEDEASLQAHFQHPNYHGMLRLLGGAGLKGAVSNKMSIDRRSPVYGADNRPTAAFD